MATAIKKFKDMTRQEKRVAVAQDLLDYMDAGLIRAGAGYFCIRKYSRAQTLAEQVKAQGCHVCAIGALFASHLLTAGRRIKVRPALGDGSFKIEGVFDAAELNLIEAVHEGYGAYTNAKGVYEDIPSDMAVAIQDFRDMFDREERIRLIAHNIIQNEGNFDADQLLFPHGKK